MTTDTDYEKAYVRHEFRFWLKEYPDGTLGSLKQWLGEVYDQCLDFSQAEDDPIIEETEDIPYPLCNYLDAFGEHDGHPFSYREENIEEDIGYVEEVIEEVGDHARLDSFPTQ